MRALMSRRQLSPELSQWVVQQALAGHDPDVVLKPLTRDGWDEQDAIDAVQAAVADYMTEKSALAGLPLPVRVPSAFELNGAARVAAGDRTVHVIANMLLPRVVVLQGLLSDEECDALIELARPLLKRSATVNMQTGGDLLHDDRTSHGMCFTRGQNALVARIEARLAHLLEWPVENGEGLQVLHYRPGAEYKPHYDYFDPAEPGSEVLLRHGGQRIGTVVMYLNTPERGGATTFPDAHFEVAAIKGNAVFFSYDRPHPMTKSLHGGAPVIDGDKWIATKWLRERPHR